MVEVIAEYVLARVAERAAKFDAENTFCAEDVADLRAAGYLGAHVPVEYGGQGATFADLVAAQVRLAGAAPATALSVTMHHVWVAAAQRVATAEPGHPVVTAVLPEAGAGKLFALALSEPGNDDSLYRSNTAAVPFPSGRGPLPGYRFEGAKVFVTASPAWDWLGTVGTDRTDADNPLCVFAFLARGPQVQPAPQWDVLGMRASHSLNTQLAQAPTERVVYRVAEGFATDLFRSAILGAFEILLAALYVGIAERSVELAVVHAQEREASGGADESLRYRVGQLAAGLLPVRAQLSAAAAAYPQREPDLGWVAQVGALKVAAVEAAGATVRAAMGLVGARSYARTSELSRLYRDALAGVFQPPAPRAIPRLAGEALFS